MDKLPRPGYRIEGIPAEITRRQTSSHRTATEDASTVVPFLQGDFLAQVPPESGIDIDSQKETQKDVVAAASTPTEQTARTLNEIKRRLLELFGTLEDLIKNRQEFSQLEYSDQIKKTQIPDLIRSIAEFLKGSALAVKDFELAGMAGFVQDKAEELMDYYFKENSNEDFSDDYEPYLEEQKEQQAARDLRSEGWFEYSYEELQVLETLGYMKDVPAYAYHGVGTPTEKAAGLFKYSEDHRRLYWNKEMRKRIDDEVGPGGLARLRGEAIKRKENADWEESEWVTCMQLGKRLDLSVPASTMNQILEAAGYQIKIDRGWWATKEAEGLYHQEGLRAGMARILWKKEMLERIKEYLASKQG